MSGGTAGSSLAATGAGAFVVGGAVLTVADVAGIALLMVIIGTGLVAMSVRLGWRRGRSATDI